MFSFLGLVIPWKLGTIFSMQKVSKHTGHWVVLFFITNTLAMQLQNYHEAHSCAVLSKKRQCCHRQVIVSAAKEALSRQRLWGVMQPGLPEAHPGQCSWTYSNCSQHGCDIKMEGIIQMYSALCYLTSKIQTILSNGSVIPCVSCTISVDSKIL